MKIAPNVAASYCWISFLLVAGLNVIRLVYCQQEPQITKDILPTIKRVGETGTLSCTVARQDNNIVTWIHGRTLDTISEDDTVVLSDDFNQVIDGKRKYDVYKESHGDSATYTLVVRRLQLQDAGSYICQIQIRGLTRFPSNTGQMVVLIPPNMIMSSTTLTRKTEEGQDVSMECNADGFPVPTIKWVRPNGKALPPPINAFTYEGNELVLTNVSRHARGVYRCIADNTVIPTASQDATLYIDFKPYATPVQTTYGQAANRRFDITLECRVSGYPSPHLQWYKVLEGNNLRPLNDDERHQVHILIAYGQMLSMEDYWFQLTIINVQGNDFGEYACQGVNRLGVHEARVRLYETSECQGAYCYLADVGGTRQSMAPLSCTPCLSLATMLVFLSSVLFA